VGEEDPNTKIVDFSRQEEQSLVPQREPEIKEEVISFSQTTEVLEKAEIKSPAEISKPIPNQELTPEPEKTITGNHTGDSRVLQELQNPEQVSNSPTAIFPSQSSQTQSFSPQPQIYPQSQNQNPQSQFYPQKDTAQKQFYPQTQPTFSPSQAIYPQTFSQPQTAVQSFSPSQTIQKESVLPAVGGIRDLNDLKNSNTQSQSSQTGNLTAENQSSTSQTENLSLNSDNISNISNIKTSSSTSENFTVNTPFNPQFQNHNSQDLVAEYGNPELNQDSKAVVFEEIKKRNAYYELLAQYLQEQIENSQNEAEKNRLENLLTKVILPELLPLATLSGLDLEIDEESLEKLTEDAKDEVKKLIEGYSDENSEAENEENNLIKLAQNSQGLINIQPNFQDSDENIKKEEIKDGEEVNETSETADATVTIPEGGVLPEFVPLSENQEPEKLANLVRTVAAIGAMPEFHPLPRNSSGGLGVADEQNPEATIGQDDPEVTDNSQPTDNSGTEEKQNEQETEESSDSEEEREENENDSSEQKDSEAIRKRDNQDSGDNQENSEKDKKPNKLRQGIDNIKNKIDPRDVARRAVKRLKDKAIAKAAQLLAKLSLQSALPFIWTVIAGILIFVLICLLVFIIVAYVYCTPKEPYRSFIEASIYAGTEVKKGRNAAAVATETGFRVVINGITKIDVIPHSFLWKAFENLPGCTGVQQGTICPAGYVAWKNVNGKWVQGGTATGGNGGDGSVDVGDGAEGVPCLSAARSGQLANPYLRAFVRALGQAESGGSYTIGNKQGCYGRYQFCPGGSWSYVAGKSDGVGGTFPSSPQSSTPEQQDLAKLIAWNAESEFRAPGFDISELTKTLESQGIQAALDKSNDGTPATIDGVTRYGMCGGWTPLCSESVDSAQGQQSFIVGVYNKVLTEEKAGKCGTGSLDLEKTNKDVANNSNFNFLNVLSGNVDVLASKDNLDSPATGGQALGNNKIPEDKLAKLRELESSGKINIDPGRSSISTQAVSGMLNIATVDFIITIANKYQAVTFSSANDGVHKGTAHGNGLGLDITVVTIDGKEYAPLDFWNGATDQGTMLAQISKDFASTGVVDYILVHSKITSQLPGEINGVKIGTDDGGHRNHWYIEIKQDGKSSDIVGGGGATVCCPPGAHPEGSVINNTNLPAPDPNAKDGEKPKKYSEITQAHRDFIAKLAKESGYTLQNSDGNGILPDAQKAFDEMAIAAKAEKDLDLKIASGYRSREDQVGVFFGKINNVFAGNPNDPTVIADYLERMRLSAPPGYSEHQTGRGMDIVSQDPKTQDLDPQKWIGTDTEKWLAENSGRYGFRITYKKDRLNSTKGTTYEPWHLFYTGNKTSLNNTNFNPLDLFKNVSVRAEETKDTTKSELDLNKAAGTVSGFDGSIAVQEIDSNGKTIGNSSNYNGNQPPASPASSIKAVIADVIIKNNIDLNKKVTITEDMIYDQKSGSYQDKHFKVGESYTVKELLDKTLSVSSNTAPNALVSLVGGPGSGVNSKIKTLGYNNTEFNGYFNSEGGNKNTITALDFTKAMSNLWQNSTARSFLSKNNDKFKLPSLGNKDAGNDSVTGNSGVFNINGKNYIITVFHNGAGGAVCDDNGDCVGENDKFVTDTTKAIIDQLGGNVSITDPGYPTDGNTDITTINAGTGCGCIAAGSGSSDFGSGGGGAGGSIPISDCGEKLLQTITDIFIKFEAGERNNPINFTVTSLNDKIFTKTREKFTEAECKFSYTPRKDDPSILFANFDGPKGKECGEYATKVYLGDLFIPSFKDTKTWGDAFEVFHPKKDAGNAAVYDQYLAAFKQVNLKIDGKEVPLTMDIKIGDLKKALSNTNCGSASNLQFNYLNQLANNNIFSPIPVSAEESATKTQNLTVNSSIIPINIRKVINQDLTDKKLDNTEVLGVRDLVNESLKSSNTTNTEKQNLQRLKQMLDVSVEYNKTIQATTSLENFELKLDNVTSEQLSKYPIAKSEGKNNLSTCPSSGGDYGNGKVVKGTESFLKYVEQQATGKPALGRCFEKVADYIDAVGYGKLGGPNGTLVGDAMSQDGFPTGMARNFAEWLNAGDNATKWGLKNILTKDMSPYNAPPGSIIVVSAGSPGTSDPVAGDITVRGIAFPDGVTAFYNDGEMGYNGPQQWNGANATNGIGKVLGVYVPIN
jgi:LAS superfamily LD-carboxypeptidase LdcB